MTQVLLTFNSARWLERTLGHLLVAGAPIVAVDNASTDATQDLLRRYQAAGQLRLIVLPANIGAAARNRGVEAVETPYVAFCDDDTWYEPAGLRLAADLLDAHPRLALITGRILVDDEQRLDPISVEMAASPLAEEHGIPGAVLVSYMGGASICRRDAFLAAGGYDPRFFLGGEEETVGWHLLRAGWQQRYVEDVVVHHHPSLANFSRLGHFGIRNTIVTAWLHRPAGSAASWTAHVLRHARKDATLVRGLVLTAAAVPWIVRERSVWAAEQEDLIRQLRSGTPSKARRYGTAKARRAGRTARADASGGRRGRGEPDMTKDHAKNGAKDSGKDSAQDSGKDELHKGDQVTWNSHGTVVPGTVEKKITSDTEEAGRKVKASSDSPQYEVKSDKSGKEAVHKPASLHKK